MTYSCITSIITAMHINIIITIMNTDSQLLESVLLLARRVLQEGVGEQGAHGAHDGLAGHVCVYIYIERERDILISILIITITMIRRRRRLNIMIRVIRR